MGRVCACGAHASCDCGKCVNCCNAPVRVSQRATAAELLAGHERGGLTDSTARAESSGFVQREAERIAARAAAPAPPRVSERSVLLAHAANLRERAELLEGIPTLSGYSAGARLLVVADKLEQLAHDLDDGPSVTP